MALRDIVANNFWWKLLSLLLAALTWLTIETALTREQAQSHNPWGFSRKFQSLPITFLTSPTNSTRFRITPAVATVDVSGPVDQLQKLQDRDIHVYIDLSDISDETQVRRQIIAQVPDSLKVDNITPANTTAQRISTGHENQSPPNHDSP